MANYSSTTSTFGNAPRAALAGSEFMAVTGRTIIVVWILSILLHIVVLGLMFLVVFPLAAGPRGELPVARLDLTGQANRPPIPTSASISALTNSNGGTSIGDRLRASVTPNVEGRLNEAIGMARPKLSIVGVGLGEGIGAGGADFSDYGLGAGGGSGPSFFGIGGNAREANRIVYVVDRSASMLDTFIHVRAELRRSIGALRRSQKFHVIFFNAGDPVENPPRNLVSAIQAQKEAFFRFLDGINPGGSTHPESAMRRALSLDPDLVYFLTDGEFEPGLIARLDEWNRHRSIRIYTIAYFDRSGAELLRRIAQEHGGEFKFVSENDLP